MKDELQDASVVLPPENPEEAMMEKLSRSTKSGYLYESFRFFHLKDKKQQEFDYHYHDFHKIVITLSGDVTYYVEGKTYYLKPWDILLVSRYDIHKPVIHSDSTYERMIFWIQNDFFNQTFFDIASLGECFRKAGSGGEHLLRPALSLRSQIQELLEAMEKTLSADAYAGTTLSAAYFLQFLVLINRSLLSPKYKTDQSAIQYDKQIEEILLYINQNLSANLSNQFLADHFFLSKYHLMHKFKQETGYTLHHYIEQKRLILAAQLMKDGYPVMKASEASGFSEYSTFLRAFRKKYHTSPKEFLSQ